MEKLSNVYISSTSAVCGKKEGEGPLAKYFDKIFKDEYLSTDSFEKAESKLQYEAVTRALEKSGEKAKNIDYIFAGDLLSQCIASSFCIRDLSIPFIGLYGACSTFVLGLINGAQFINSKSANKVAVVSSSHFCASERQFRYPLEYGSQRPQSAQWTTTAAGCTILKSTKTNIKITNYKVGKIVDLGVTDANNMGAAMAPAAYDTINGFFKETNTSPADYDCIFTGDLGKVGSQLLDRLFSIDGIDIAPYHKDCGQLIFNRNLQDVHSGGSGCGCVASVFCGYIMENLKSGKLKHILLCGTGALLSPVSVNQGESIPSIAHLVEITAE